MIKKLTREECFAKAKAYAECSDYLMTDWTDNRLEAEYGNKIAQTLRRRADKWWKKGRKR